MLRLSSSYLDKPIMSLRTGEPVGTTISPIINPNNLKIEGFYCSDRFSKNRLILLSQEIREVIDEGIVVNDHDAMSETDDLVRLQTIIGLKFSVLGKKVTTKSKDLLGKVSDYAVDSENMYIQKLYVSQSLVKHLTGGQLSIDRSQIVEITDKKIVINDPVIPIEDTVPMPSPLVV